MARRSKKTKIINQSVTAPVPKTESITLPKTPWWTRDWVWALLLVLAVILVYLPIWHAGYIWDDEMILSANPCIVGPLGLREIWTTSAAKFYPFVLTTFWVEHALWGLASLPYHLVNMGLHAASAVVLWRVLQNLNVRGAWLGAALWALHPVQVETAAWISEMKNTESCFFYLLTILFFIRSLKHPPQHTDRWNTVLTFLCAALAMASKSSTLLLPVILALCIWWMKGKWQWRDMSKVGLILLMAGVAAFLTSLTVRQNGTDEMHWAESWQERVAIGGDVFWFYLGKLIWPHPLITFYPRWEINTGLWTSYIPIAAVVLVPTILWFQRRSWARPYLFAYVYYLLNLLPVMGLFTMTGFRYSLVEDHLQYIASMGPLALAGSELTRVAIFVFSRRQVLRYVLGAGFLLIPGIQSWQQSWVYHDDHGLWMYNLSKNPNSWLAYNGLGVELDREGRFDEAIQYLQKSIAINPNYAMTHQNLAGVYLEKRETDEALAEYNKSLAINPNGTLPRLKIAEADLRTGQADEAIALDRAILNIEPYSELAYNNLGLAYLQKGQVDDAIAQYRKALALNPNFAMIYNNLGSALFQNGQTAEAIAQYKKALELDPKIILTPANLAMALTQMGVSDLQNGQVDEAINQFQEAIKYDPNIAQAHTNLGITYAQRGQLDEALAQFQETLRLKPDDSAAQVNLAKVKTMIQERASSQ
jgi:tetratricopeptide (TPR) repeat protein